MGLRTIVARTLGAACIAALPLAGLAAEAEGAPRVIPNTTSGPIQVPPVVSGQHVTGSVFIGYRGTDGQTTGGIVTLSPAVPAFLRLGAEVTPRSPDGAVRLLWGLGFEDWRDRTFYVRVEDWGPVRLDRSFTLRAAEATLGYKLPTLCGGPFCLAPSPFVALPFDGGPYLGGRTTVTVGRTWFVSAAVGWTMPGVLPGSVRPDPWRISFALGRWDWRPGGLFVTYRDDVSTQQLRDRTQLYRGGNGVLAIGVNWAY